MTKVKQTWQINYSDFIKFVRFAIEILYIKPSSLSHNFVFSYVTYRHTFRRCLLALGKHAVPSKADIWWRNGNVRGQSRSQNDTKKVGKIFPNFGFQRQCHFRADVYKHSKREPLKSRIVTKCLSLLIENLTHSESAGVPSFLREKTLFSKKQPSLTI